MLPISKSISQKNVHWTHEHLALVLDSCRLNNREAQKELYCNYYGFAMSISLRYSSNYDSAASMANDSFLKLFGALTNFRPLYSNSAASFAAWFKKIIVNTCIDHIRRSRKQNIADMEIEEVIICDPGQTAEGMLQHKEVIKCIQQLSPAYRAAINLYAIEGYSHAEIARQFQITEATSKSNLFKARQKLRSLLKNCNAISQEQIETPIIV